MLGALLDLAGCGFAARNPDRTAARKVLHNHHSIAASRFGMAKAKKRVFSVVKAVKENARDRVGPVPPERVIPDPKQKAAAKPKHKETLADLLSPDEES
jgi:hypothetical protein